MDSEFRKQYGLRKQAEREMKELRQGTARLKGALEHPDLYPDPMSMLKKPRKLTRAERKAELAAMSPDVAAWSQALRESI